MQVQTRVMGSVEVAEDHKIRIPDGLFGFEDYTDYVLIESKCEPFLWLQSLTDSNLAFLVVDPFIINNDYEVDVDDKELSKIDIEDPGDVSVLCVVTIPKDGGPVTANFQGPLIVNRKNSKCMQVVLNDPRWSVKENILESLKKKGAE